MTLPDFLKMQGYDTSKIEQPKEEPAKPEPKEAFIKKVELKPSASCSQFKKHGVSNDYSYENESWVRVMPLTYGDPPRPQSAGKNQREGSPTTGTRAARKSHAIASKWKYDYEEGRVFSYIGGDNETDATRNYFIDGTDPSMRVAICLVRRVNPTSNPDANWLWTVYARYDYDRDAPRRGGPKGRDAMPWRGKRMSARAAVECPLCKQSKGENCVSPETGSEVKVHYERVRKYIIEREGSDTWFENYESDRFTKKVTKNE